MISVYSLLFGNWIYKELKAAKIQNHSESATNANDWST